MEILIIMINHNLDTMQITISSLKKVQTILIKILKGKKVNKLTVSGHSSASFILAACFFSECTGTWWWFGNFHILSWDLFSFVKNSFKNENQKCNWKWYSKNNKGHHYSFEINWCSGISFWIQAIHFFGTGSCPFFNNFFNDSILI